MIGWGLPDTVGLVMSQTRQTGDTFNKWNAKNEKRRFFIKA